MPLQLWTCSVYIDWATPRYRFWHPNLNEGHKNAMKIYFFTYIVQFPYRVPVFWCLSLRYIISIYIYIILPVLIHLSNPPFSGYPQVLWAHWRSWQRLLDWQGHPMQFHRSGWTVGWRVDFPPRDFELSNEKRDLGWKKGICWGWSPTQSQWYRDYNTSI